MQSQLGRDQARSSEETLSSFDIHHLPSMCPSIQMNYFAIDKFSELQINQQVSYFSNFC